MRLLWLLALLGCSDNSSSPDANTYTAAITPQLCTAGSPGDATCPITHVDLGNGELQFYVQQDTAMATLYYISGPKLHGGASGLYISHPRFEAWPEGASAPTANPNDPNATTIVNLVANTDTVLTPTMIAGGPRMTFAYDAIGPHR